MVFLKLMLQLILLSEKYIFLGNLKLNQRVWNQKAIQLNLPFKLLTIFV